MKRLALLVLALLTLSLTACTGTPKLPSSADVISARQRAEVVVTLSEQGLEGIKTVARQASDAGMLKAADYQVVEATLSEARGVLVEAKDWISGKGAKPTRARVLFAIDRVETALKLVRASGVQVPAVTDQALQLARDLIAEQSATQ